jgi:hypothetical protein
MEEDSEIQMPFDFTDRENGVDDEDLEDEAI